MREVGDDEGHFGPPGCLGGQPGKDSVELHWIIDTQGIEELHIIMTKMMVEETYYVHRSKSNAFRICQHISTNNFFHQDG